MFNDVQLPREAYNTEEHQLLRETIQQYISKEILPHRERWEEQGYCDDSAWTSAGELGLLNLSLSEVYGGGGLDFSFSALLIEESSRMGLVAPAISMHSDIVAVYIETYGSEMLKQKYLPAMAAGTQIGSLAMTEPGTGSDVQAIQTNAVDKGDHWLLNGSKTFITIGYTSTFTIVACKTRPGTDQEGISLLIVDAALAGFSKGKPFKKLGLKESDTCELFFEDVKVPKDHIIGEEGMGFIYMMKELPRERLTIAIQAIGAAHGAIDETIEYVTGRMAFKSPIAGFQNTQFKLAELATQLQVYQAYIDKCIRLLATHQLSAEAASMAKLGATELEARVMDECLQLFGGYGYIWEYAIARRYANARVTRIYGGTNEIMKLMISRKLLKRFTLEAKAKSKKNILTNHT